MPEDIQLDRRTKPSEVDPADSDSPTIVVSDNASQGEQPAVVTTKLQFALILLGLGLSVFLALLDQTIVSVAIPAVAKEFQSLDQVAWIGTAFFLTSWKSIYCAPQTAFTPTYGKFADIFGRKAVFLAAVLVFEVGSVLCGASVNMNMLIVSRAIAGLGGGGIFSLSIIIISDLSPIRDRAKYQGVVGAFFGFASVASPLLGGLFTDHLSWRWNFYINVPLGAVTILVSLFLLKLPHTGQDWRAQLRRVDMQGTVVLVCAVIALLIPIQGGGTQFEWNSPVVISLFVVAAVLIGVFVVIESRLANEPIMPLELFTNTHSVAVFVTTTLLGMATIGAVFYVPVYFQVVNGDTATQAGLNTVPLIAGMIVFTIVAGIVSSTTGIYMPSTTASVVLLTVGLGLLSTLTSSSPMGIKVLYLIIAGAEYWISSPAP
ncbi:hypothetical protein HK105_200904 [Polyrhizophydium stewartii]|uniref:Major facilitator superfamily (MFS) profile domain-containing protein n=1 Tax=Polyrhizophydium stewartii TaxID=2732419 RepID=A0ABR4NIH6_9FUNG